MDMVVKEDLTQSSLKDKVFEVLPNIGIIESVLVFSVLLFLFAGLLFLSYAVVKKDKEGVITLSIIGVVLIPLMFYSVYGVVKDRSSDYYISYGVVGQYVESENYNVVDNQGREYLTIKILKGDGDIVEVVVNKQDIDTISEGDDITIETEVEGVKLSGKSDFGYEGLRYSNKKYLEGRFVKPKINTNKFSEEYSKDDVDKLTITKGIQNIEGIEVNGLEGIINKNNK